MQLDLDDDEIRALLNVLIEVIDADKYPRRRGCRCCARCWPNLARSAACRPSLRRQMPPPAAPRPEPKVYEPPSRGRYKRR